MAETIQQAFHNLSLVLADITPEIKPSHEDSLLTSFTTSFLAIMVCEIGDKTFFLGMIMAMKYNKLVVFTGAFLALALMTVLSAIGGKVVFSFIPKIYTDIIVTLLFFYFGFKLIYEAYTADEEEGENEELKEVEQQVKEMEEKLIRRSQQEQGIELDDKVGPNKKKKTLVIPDSTILTQAFIMTFLAEWGDRSQIATIALAASYNLFMVNVGALLGHFLCTGGAVQLGEWISKKVSEKQVHYAGGIVFVLSGVVTMWMMFSHDG